MELVDLILKNNPLIFDSEFYLQIKGTTMGRIFSPTYANVTMEYHEINVYSIIRQGYALVSKYFENSLLRFLGDCQILLKVNFIIVQTNRLKTICPIYIKPLPSFFKKYTFLTCKKNIYHC